MNFNVTKVFTLYVLKTDIWKNLIDKMTESLTIQRMGLSYHEIADFIKQSVNAKFEQFYGDEEPTLENAIIRQFVNSTNWFEIAKYIYPTAYNTAMIRRTTQADSYNEAERLQQEFLENEADFFEDEYLKIFENFFSEIP